MSSKSLIVIVLCAWFSLFIIHPFYALAKDDAELLFRFAEQLRNEQEFYRAITEYQRFLAYFPESPKALDAYFNIFDCYFLGERYLDAMAWCRRIQSNYPQEEVISLTKFNIGKCLFKVENYSSAKNFFSDVIATAHDSVLKDQARYWSGLCYLRESEWEKAFHEFSAIPANSPLSTKSQFAARRALEGNSLPRKNPLLAGLFSIVPGGGYVYTGSVQTGLAALLVNSLFALGAYSAFREEGTGVGVFISVITLGWYTGGIYGSVVGAHKYNFQIKRHFWREFDF